MHNLNLYKTRREKKITGKKIYFNNGANIIHSNNLSDPLVNFHLVAINLWGNYQGSVVVLCGHISIDRQFFVWTSFYFLL